MREAEDLTGEALGSDSSISHTYYPVTGRQRITIFSGSEGRAVLWDEEINRLRRFLNLTHDKED